MQKQRLQSTKHNQIQNVKIKWKGKVININSISKILFIL